MQPWRQELRELIRSVETVLSLEAFGAPLSAEERGVILLCAEDLAKKFSTLGTRNRTAMTRITSLRGRLGLTSNRPLPSPPTDFGPTQIRSCASIPYMPSRPSANGSR